LVTSMEAHYFIADGEIIYDHASSKDKEFLVIEGALHGLTPCVPCQTTPGQYSNTVNNLFNYIRDWTNKRFAN
jgi:hypothetical protein